MYRKVGREFSRKDQFDPQPRRGPYRGQYVRRRTPSGGGAHYRAGSFSDDRYDSSPPPQPHQHQQHQPHQQHQHQHQQQPASNNNNTINNNNHRGLANNEPVPYAPSQYQQQRSLPPRMQRGAGHQNQRGGPVRSRYESSQQQDMYHAGSHEQVAGGDMGGALPARRGRAPKNFRNHDQQPTDSTNDYNNKPDLQQQQQPALQPQMGQRESKKVDELSRSLERHKAKLEEMKGLVSKLSLELELVKSRVKELETSALKSHSTDYDPQTAGAPANAAVNDKENKRKEKKLKQREKKALKTAERRAQISDNNNPSHHPDGGSTPQQQILSSEQLELNPDKQQDTNGKPGPQPGEGAEPNQELSAAPQQPTTKQPYNKHKKRFPKRDFKDKANKPLPKVNKSTNVNDDSTTQAAEPSSEDRLEGEDGRDGATKERIKIRRKKPHMARRGAYSNRRRRADSSERNSNDTSPQGEGNASDKEKNPPATATTEPKTFPELDEAELNELVQTFKREFLNSERPVKAIKETMNTKGPKVVYEFAVSILDHAICDVTSPTKLTEIANSLHQLIVIEVGRNEVDFRQCFYDALKDISKREEDIAIDAPRYMDTLGQLLADCIAPMWSKQRDTIKPFLENILQSYCEQNRASLLASIMKGIASAKSDRFAKEVWDAAELKWDSVLVEGTNLDEFLESHDVKFTTQTFPAEPKNSKEKCKELEKFADDVTSLVEKHCTAAELEDLFKELNLDDEAKVPYMGTLVYAIVRGCLSTEAGVYELNTNQLNEYSSILNTQSKDQDSIVLLALTALTKLWHSYNCPQDLFMNILMAMHSSGTASVDALKEWLNSETLNNVPGIGAARLSSKRLIEDKILAPKS